MTDAPLIIGTNLLTGAAFAVLTGTESPSYKVDSIADGDLLSPAVIQADGGESGGVDITATLASAAMPTVILLGGHRHDTAGARSVAASALLTVAYWDGAVWNTILNAAPNDGPSQGSRIYRLNAHPPSTQYLIRLNYFDPLQVLTIPEIVLAEAVEMDFIELGYDPYREVTIATKFEAETGRRWVNVTGRRLELKPQWSAIDPTLAAKIDLIREQRFEAGLPIWWAWMPDTRPTEVYLMQAKQVPHMPIARAGNLRSITLDLVEAV